MTKRFVSEPRRYVLGMFWARVRGRVRGPIAPKGANANPAGVQLRSPCTLSQHLALQLHTRQRSEAERKQGGIKGSFDRSGGRGRAQPHPRTRAESVNRAQRSRGCISLIAPPARQANLTRCVAAARQRSAHAVVRPLAPSCTVSSARALALRAWCARLARDAGKPLVEQPGSRPPRTCQTWRRAPAHRVRRGPRRLAQRRRTAGRGLSTFSSSVPPATGRSRPPAAAGRGRPCRRGTPRG